MEYDPPESLAPRATRPYRSTRTIQRRLKNGLRDMLSIQAAELQGFKAPPSRALEALEYHESKGCREAVEHAGGEIEKYFNDPDIVLPRLQSTDI